MSNEGSGGNDEPNAWEPVEDRDLEEQLDERERHLEERERELNKRERELEQREQEILERREENVEKREELDAREADLDDLRERQQEREQELNRREKELEEREAEIDTKREALEEYASSGRTFTSRPRIAGGILMGVVGVVSLLLAAGIFLNTTSAGLVVAGLPLVGQTPAQVLTAVFALVAVIEFLGGYFSYVGRRWSVSVLAGILGIVVFLPVGVTATIMVTVGESQFD